MSRPLHPAVAGAQDAPMASRQPHLLLLLLAVLAGSAVAQDDDITIYRCTDAKGRLTLQDSPCAKDQSQQTRRMLQPQDPPAHATPAAVAPAMAPPSREPPPTIARYAPRPMYECVRPDGGTYTSDDGAGNPRWVSSAWPIYDDGPMYAPGIAFARSSTSGNAGPAGGASGSVRNPSSGNGAPQIHFRNTRRPEPPSRPPPRHGRGHGRGHGFDFGYGGGMWVQDECNALPQAEVCSRLRDRREEIRRRFFNAQETERATLDKEERGINARLSEDCGGA